MIHLFDYYTQESRDLHASLKKAGYDWLTVVVDPDGFLPDGIVSPFTYYLGDESGKPLYFNQVPKPTFWLIDGNGTSAKILDYTQERARIVYNSESQNRFVEKVEWLSQTGMLRKVDRYNKYGRRFSQTSVRSDGQYLFTSYYSVEEKEIILENHITGDIIFTFKDEPMRMFKNRTEFLRFFLERLEIDLTHIVINSLSIPFFHSYNLSLEGQDVLFWQEPIYGEIPGNMKLILDNETRVKKIYVPDHHTYNQLLAEIPEDQHHKLGHVGYVYDFIRENQFRSDALILTNSDQIEQLETLISALPQVHFRIAALTEMSAKLMEMLRFTNVTLYQNISTAKLDQLFAQSDIYLDINYANEVMHATRRAFMNNMLLFAFNETVHSRYYLPSAHIFAKDKVSDLIASIEHALVAPEQMTEALMRQKEHANDIDAVAFRAEVKSILGE